jgi:hypothetical protein
MKRYSNSKAKRIAGGNKPSNELDETVEIEQLLARRENEKPESGSQLQRYCTAYSLNFIS